MRGQPTRGQLLEAMRAARCTGDLDTALRSPALAIALTNTALAIARVRSTPQRPDIKRRAAGDND